MYEARKLLEVGAAGMAAERAAPERIAAMAEEVANLFSAMNDPQAFLVHDIDFHRSVAAASGNPIIAAVMEMISSLYYERRRETAARATQRNLRDAAEMHRRVYQAIRAGNAEAARAAMSEHLTQSSSYQAQEAENDGRTSSGILGPPGRTSASSSDATDEALTLRLAALARGHPEQRRGMRTGKRNRMGGFFGVASQTTAWRTCSTGPTTTRTSARGAAAW